MAIAKVGEQTRSSDPVRRERARISAARAIVHMSRYTRRELSPAIIALADKPLPQHPSS
jgi:hypothetical protein